MSALAPVSERLHSTWVGWIDDADADLTIDGTRLVGVTVPRAQYDAYYLGFANQVLWPIFHGLTEHAAARGPESSTWWTAYGAVNRAFAERVAEVAAPEALVWVQDYHLLLVPQLLRALRPDLRIAVFLHIPFPELESFAAEPWAEELVTGFSFADLIGTQREGDATRLRLACERFAPRAPEVQAFPISIDTLPVLRDAHAAHETTAVSRVRAKYQAQGRQLLLGVDRLDYTKGILERIEAFAEVLHHWTETTPHPVLVQVLTPTRETIPAYHDYAQRVAQATSAVNERFATGDYAPIVTLSGPIPHDELTALFLAANVMCVTPLRDGMNLVAKEFAISRLDERGVLLLSSEAGAADELVEAVVVDPRSPTALAAGMRLALDMPDSETAQRMQALRARVFGHDVHAWASEFLRAADA